MANGWGGSREGAGRKPEDHEPSADGVAFERERALHEKVKRQQREFKLAQEMGEYVPRVAVQQASATAVALLTQGCRSIPDLLERACNLTPDQAALAQEQIDSILSELAVAMKSLAGPEPVALAADDAEDDEDS